jgi:hypothetical protein
MRCSSKTQNNHKQSLTIHWNDLHWASIKRKMSTNPFLIGHSIPSTTPSPSTVSPSGHSYSSSPYLIVVVRPSFHVLPTVLHRIATSILTPPPCHVCPYNPLFCLRVSLRWLEFRGNKLLVLACQYESSALAIPPINQLLLADYILSLELQLRVNDKDSNSCEL